MLPAATAETRNSFGRDSTTERVWRPMEPVHPRMERVFIGKETCKKLLKKLKSKPLMQLAGWFDVV